MDKFYCHDSFSNIARENPKVFPSILINHSINDCVTCRVKLTSVTMFSMKECNLYVGYMLTLKGSSLQNVFTNLLAEPSTIQECIPVGCVPPAH